MRPVIKTVSILSASLLLYSCAAAPHQAAFKEAVQANNYDQAYGILSDVCSRTPADSICEKMPEVSQKYADGVLAKLSSDLRSEPRPVPLERLKEFKDKASLAKKVYAKAAVDSALKSIETEEKATASKVEAALKEAGEARSRGELTAAYDSFLSAFRLDPSVKPKLDEYASAASAQLYEAGARAASEDDWKAANKAFGEAAHINPDYKDLKKRLEEAGAKDSAEYYVGAGEKAAKSGDLEKAVQMYSYAVKYRDTEETRSLLTKTRVEAVNALFRKSASLIDSERTLTSGLVFIRALNMINDIPKSARTGVEVSSSEASRLVDELFVKAKKEKDAGNKGMAYMYVNTILKIQPSYSDAIAWREQLKNEIKRRSLQSLAVIPAKSPSYNADAGGIVTSAMLNFLYKELSTDVKILERSAIEALLKESEVKTLQSAEGKGVISLGGADFLLVSDVVNYKVDSTIADSFNTVRVKVGEKKVTEGKTDQAQEGQAPKSTLVPIYDEVKYKVAHHKKTGVVTVSYRIVDSNGDVVYTDIAEKKVEFQSDASEGIQVGELKLPTKIADIPTDTDVLKDAQTAVTALIGTGLKKVFYGHEERLFKAAENFKKAGNYRDALERLVDASFVLERKGKETQRAESVINAMIEEGRF